MAVNKVDLEPARKLRAKTRKADVYFVSALTGKGLPGGIWGKSDVAVAPSDSRRVYALIEAEEGGLFRSDDGGDKWERINGSHYLRIRPWYFNTFAIDPSNADVIFCSALRLLKSIDGGKSFKQVLHFRSLKFRTCLSPFPS